MQYRFWVVLFGYPIFSGRYMADKNAVVNSAISTGLGSRSLITQNGASTQTVFGRDTMKLETISITEPLQNRQHAQTPL